MTPFRTRRPVLAVAGSAGTLPDEVEAQARALGRLAVDAGFRVATGGRDGVMEAVSRGAHESDAYAEGDVIAILPTYRREMANPWADIVIPTGAGVARNVMLVASADVVVAVRGGSGTMSEIALAWQLGKPIVALASTGGWAEKLAGVSLDERRGDAIHRADDPAAAIAIALELLAQGERPNPTRSLDPA